MFASLDGHVERIGERQCIVCVGGVGYNVAAPSRDLDRLPDDQSVRLLIHTRITEGDISLFGFADVTGLAAFRRLIAVQGLGPTTAISILSAMTPADLYRSVLSRDEKLIAKCKGVGAKTAQRVVLDLQKHAAESLAALDGGCAPLEGHDERTMTRFRQIREIAASLAGLGYPQADAEQAVRRAFDEHDDDDEKVVFSTALSILNNGADHAPAMMAP